jgi:hypothetical protein
VIKPFGGFFFSLDRRFRSVEGSRSARMKLRLPIDLPETPGGDPLTQPSNWIAVASPTRYYEDARYYANVKGVSACVVDIAQAIPQLSNVRNTLLTRANDGAKLRVVGTRVSASNPLQPTGPTIDVEVRVEVYVDPKTADTHVLVVFQHDQFPYYDSSIVVTPRNGGALDYGLTSYGAIGAGPGTCADGPTLGNLSAPAPVQSARFVITPEGALFGSNGNTRVGNPIAMGDWLMPQDTCERQAREQARQPFEKPPGRLAGS